MESVLQLCHKFSKIKRSICPPLILAYLENIKQLETVHSLAESLLAISKIRTHLMALGEDQETFESLQSVERIFIKKSLE